MTIEWSSGDVTTFADWTITGHEGLDAIVKPDLREAFNETLKEHGLCIAWLGRKKDGRGPVE